MKTKWPVMTSKNPWHGLVPPLTADAISARRVDSELPWDFFWARSVDNHHLLVLRHSPESSPQQRLPTLRGIQMYLVDNIEEGARTLVLQLDNAALRDVFLRLCLDIVTAASGAASESEAVGSFVARTWRWHHLLRGGGDLRLSPEEQKGLIGELIVLGTLLLPMAAIQDAISTWRGPLGAPKDFEIGRTCIEAKARRGAATPFIAISSEHQLDLSGIDALFLHVTELSEEQSANKDGLTVSDFAARTHAAFASQSPQSVEQFETLLSAAGFRWEDDYHDMRWKEGTHHIFRVDKAFPAITARACPPGISNVRYSIGLAECERHRVDVEALVIQLAGERYGS
ncbi:MAG: PD-(D/E)XK motif protein [Candidatus Dormibacteria bacterium]